jgi:putative ABC transport system permease protein
MVRPADPATRIAKVAELRAVQAAYPLYGTILLQGGQTYSHSLLEQHGALVRPELLSALQLKVGDQIAVGQTMFTIRGVIAREPGGGPGGFSLGPRIYIDYDDLASTGLLSFGSRAQRLMFVRVPDNRVADLMTALRRDLREDFINSRSYRSREDQVGRDFDRAEDYLSLVGLVIVILGGIAVSSVTRVFILQKIRSIAVLKCIGARSAQIITVYILQVLVLGLAGSLLASRSLAPRWPPSRWRWRRPRRRF